MTHTIMIDDAKSLSPAEHNRIVEIINDAKRAIADVYYPTPDWSERVELSHAYDAALTAVYDALSAIVLEFDSQLICTANRTIVTVNNTHKPEELS